MLNGRFGNETIGSGTHVWKFVERQKAGTMTFEQMTEAVHCAAAINGGAALVHGMQMCDQVHRSMM